MFSLSMPSTFGAFSSQLCWFYPTTCWNSSISLLKLTANLPPTNVPFHGSQKTGPFSTASNGNFLSGANCCWESFREGRDKTWKILVCSHCRGVPSHCRHWKTQRGVACWGSRSRYGRSFQTFQRKCIPQVSGWKLFRSDEQNTLWHFIIRRLL